MALQKLWCGLDPRSRKELLIYIYIYIKGTRESRKAYMTTGTNRVSRLQGENEKRGAADMMEDMTTCSKRNQSWKNIVTPEEGEVKEIKCA